MQSSTSGPHRYTTHRTGVSAVVLSVFVIGLGSCHCYSQSPPLLEVELPRGRLVGMPVHWDDTSAAMLEPDGRFHVFEVQQVRSHRRLDDTFLPQSLTTARIYLQAELGKNYETFVAGPYVIATPGGEASRWRSRFTSLLSGYTRYFEVRGWPLRRPDFPLLVIVFQSRSEFVRYCARESSPVPSQAVGSYFPESNRCVLYQISGVRGTNWSETEATIVHEAVHQLAYNTGVHERLAENPLWFVEGLATMFEQPAVYDLGVSRSTIATRMHAEKVALLQPLLAQPDDLKVRLAHLIQSDHLYRSEPHTAYALGWAMTFYLAERMPTEYRRFIEIQSKRPFGAYRASQRQRDFHSAFGTDVSMLTRQMIRLFQRGR